MAYEGSGGYGTLPFAKELYNLSRVFKTDISAVLTVKSGLDPHRLEFQLQDPEGSCGDPNQEFQDYDEF
ncbi:hypothetical protein U9M48_028128 [Paspalum notatum var. saurae]|uniref:Uncharacterized protein n=1 Tax=Paspalum notatum var. saurae TaxID=547442 RepID=A0AAQ3TVX0_PASNO